MNNYIRGVESALDAALEREKVLRAENEVLKGETLRRSCCLEDEVKLENITYKVDVCVIAPAGESVDGFTALNVIGIFAKQLYADYEQAQES